MRRSLVVQVIAAIFAGSVVASGSDLGTTTCDAPSGPPNSLLQVLHPTSGSQFRLASVADPPIAIDGGVGDITNISEFLERCPTNDPVYQKIRIDFQIRRNDEIVGDIPCSEPISSIPVADYTDELITLQGLRTMFWMDRGLAGHLPWTSARCTTGWPPKSAASTSREAEPTAVSCSTTGSSSSFRNRTTPTATGSNVARHLSEHRSVRS